MTYQATVFEVMIASPGDVSEERAIVRETLFEWNVVNASLRRAVVLPRGWETHSVPTMGEPPQTAINKQVLVDADLLVGVFWTRIGTATESYASGSVEEIEEHIKVGKPAMLYFSNAPVPPDKVDSDQYKALREFRKACEKRALYDTFNSRQEFREKFARHLALKMNDLVAISSNTGSEVEQAQPHAHAPELSSTASLLLKEASRSATGQIYRLGASGGIVVQVNGKSYSGTHGEGKQRAELESALKELVHHGLAHDPNGKQVLFELTAEGFRVGELIND